MSPKQKTLALPIAIYTRVSEQGRRSNEELLSHELQRAKVASYLVAKDLKASPRVFGDNDKSGGSMTRPALDEIVAGIGSEYGGLAVAYLDRFARNVQDGLKLIEEIERRGGAVIALDAEFDTSTAMGKAMLRIVLTFGELYRDQSIEKAAYLAETKLAENTSLGGKPPVGFVFEVLGVDAETNKPRHGKYLRDDATADLVAEAFERFASKELATPGRVADFLNDNGLTTIRGNKWNAMSVRGFLKRKAYMGVRTYGEVEVAGGHEVIVSPEVFRRAQRRLEPVKGPQTRVHGDGHVLGEGLLRCGSCGGGLSKSVANGRYQTLRCNARGKGHAAISYAAAEDWIVGVAFAHTGLGALVAGGNAAEIDAAQARVDSAQAELNAVEALQGTVEPASFMLAHSDALKAVKDAETAKDALIPDGGTASLIFPAGKRELYEALEVPDKRAALKSIIKRVVVAPGRAGNISERIAVEFQDGAWHPADAAPGYMANIPDGSKSGPAPWPLPEHVEAT